MTNVITEKTQLQAFMRKLSIIQLICAFLGAMCFVIGNELLWSRVQKNGQSLSIQRGEALAQSVQLIASQEMCGTVAQAGFRVFAPILFFQVQRTLLFFLA